ncbi:hypothetical protein ACJMK2_032599 [Sinanodonta woodiana]|uniref:DUF7042 domain-containing protein n=1 Tax=Sinanodonta woodiana TaxID=1069815 RepID=A0ABD3X2E7_SINWO
MLPLGMNLISIIIFITQCVFVHVQKAAGTCVLPIVFRNSAWRDSTKGDLIFTATTMSGWRTTANTQTISHWECFIESEYKLKGYLIFKSLQTAIFNGVNYTGYMCMQLTKVTDYSYFYYLVQPQQRIASEERIWYSKTATADINTICNTSSKEPLEQFHMLVKTGYEWEARQYCPNPVLGNFYYTYFGSDGIVYCHRSLDQWQVCGDQQTMTFNYTTCNKIMAYSSGGQVWCVGTVSSKNTFVMVYNNDSDVDELTTFRFTCFSISSNGRKASMVPKNCTENQIPTTFAKRHDGQNMGAKLELVPYLTCAFTSNTTKEAGVNIGAIVGGALGGVVLIIVAAGCYIVYRHRSRPLADDTAVEDRANNACDVQTDRGPAEVETILNLSARIDLDLINDSFSLPDDLQVSNCTFQEQHTGRSNASTPDHDFSNLSVESSFESC